MALIISATALITHAAHAHDYKQGAISIAHPWARQTAPSQKVGGSFMTISNSAKSGDKLLSATSSIAEKVEIHTMTMENGVMKMRPVSGGLDVPAGGRLELKPGSYHIMFIGLKAPLKLGEMLPLTLHFQHAGKAQVKIKVEPINYGSEGGHDHH
ncbi:MAG: copper chaperone PCu(A)C [Sphingobium sp.]|nr:copper chaperone PCu(A)C [Sphingobium sp.]